MGQCLRFGFVNAFLKDFTCGLGERDAATCGFGSAFCDLGEAFDKIHVGCCQRIDFLWTAAGLQD